MGSGLSAYIRKTNNISVAFFGDGATDEGVFYESLNFAALHKLPVLFVCENNLFSTHLPILYRHPADNLYQKAKQYKVKSIRLDGNNALEMAEKSKEAIESIRSGSGPVFIEARTFNRYRQ